MKTLKVALLAAMTAFSAGAWSDTSSATKSWDEAISAASKKYCSDHRSQNALDEVKKRVGTVAALTTAGTEPARTWTYWLIAQPRAQVVSAGGFKTAEQRAGLYVAVKGETCAVGWVWPEQMNDLESGALLNK